MESAYDRIQYYKLSRKEKDEIIKKIRKSLAKDKRIQLAIIFGSLTTRDYVRDLDICISSNPKLNFKERLDLNAEIELELGIPVDLLELENLPENLQTRIVRNGIIIKGSKNLLTKLLSQLDVGQS
ncbi:MAG: nucleotidyltransferase domain-containing protein [Candidatus Bathyarchaeia archaeon]